jgi:hypothetical protein
VPNFKPRPQFGKTTPKMTALKAKSETERFTIELTRIARVLLGTDLLNQRTLGAIVENRWLSGTQKWGGPVWCSSKAIMDLETC